MTLNELKNIHQILFQYRHSESCYIVDSMDETDEAIRLINREINLKTMNVTKSKEDDSNMKTYGE